MIKLFGDETEAWAHLAELPNGYEAGWPFVAEDSGTLETLKVFLDHGNAKEVEIGVFADAAGKPGVLLGSGLITGGPFPEKAWLEKGGFSIEVTEGQTYWIVVCVVSSGAILFGETPSGSPTAYRAAAKIEESGEWTASAVGPSPLAATGQIVGGINLGGSSATATTSFALTAQTEVPLSASEATSTTTLELTAPGPVFLPLGASTATSGTSITLKVSAKAELKGEGIAMGEGFSWLTWPPQPRIPPALEDLWFYGYSRRRRMPGVGAARAGGEGEL